MKYTLTAKQTEVCSTDKQCIIVKGDRRSGKSFSGYILTLAALLKEDNKTAYFIVPTLRHGINMMKDVVQLLDDCKDYIWKINKCYHRIEFRNGSSILIFTPTDVFSYEFKGYKRPDFVFVDDLELFDKRTSKRIFEIIKENYVLRNWVCRFFVTYYPVQMNDRNAALFRLAGSNKNWFRTEMYMER